MILRVRATASVGPSATVGKPVNVAKGRRRRLPAVAPRRSYIGRADHIAGLLDAAGRLDAAAIKLRGQRRALLAVLVFAGLRISECLALLWRDVDLARGEILVRKSKTDAGVRRVRILPVLRDELLALRVRLHDPAPSSLAFPTSTGKRQSPSNVRSRVLQKAIGEANTALVTAELEPLSEGLTPHSLRRTFASLLFAIGEPPPWVMRQMGHTTPAPTLAIYAREMDRRDGEPERLKRSSRAPTGHQRAPALPAPTAPARTLLRRAQPEPRCRAKARGEPEDGLEPTTYRLQGDCSTN